MRTLVNVAAGAVALLALAGCGGAKPVVSAMAQGPIAEDKLPTHVNLGPEADPDSARLLAEQDDYAFYATRADPDGFCVVIVNRQVDSDWVTGCATSLPPHFNPRGQSPIKVAGPAGVIAKLALDGYDATDDLADGWEQLHPNLLVRGL
ncbi:hypothetical protein [Arthrobacter sp. NPDC089319]|uniref:hypothetical protein n=1 Tax=Arthrobacter sp. NPDC089319 TaxID=3155915 RepID=UPI0034341C86